VAECLGSLLSLQPDALVPRLVALCDEGRAAATASSDDVAQEAGVLVRWTVATSLKHAMRAMQVTKINDFLTRTRTPLLHPHRLHSSLKGTVCVRNETLTLFLTRTSPQDPDQCATCLAPHLAYFLVGGLAPGEDLSVRHATLQLCNACVHHQPKLAAPLLADPILPALFAGVTLKVPLTGGERGKNDTSAPFVCSRQDAPPFFFLSFFLASSRPASWSAW
jgi:hypothetical protein